MSIFEVFTKNVRSIIATVVVLASFAFLFVLIKKPVPEGNRDLINLSAGLVLGVLANVVGYYFGSSKDKSDRDKADIVAQTGENPPPVS